MNKLFKNTALVVLAALTMGTSVQALAHKVGIVDMQTIYSQVPQTAAIDNTLKSEFSERRQELEKLQGDIRFEMEKFQREAPTMSEDQKKALGDKINSMQKQFNEKGRPLEQEIKQRQNQELAKLQKTIITAIEEIAKDGDFDEVKVKDGTIYFNPKEVTDLSEKVVERVSKK
ncbi:MULTISPECIES: OmpH family outer membrane protein [unclassified Pseudoalteromonas]|uniref:OmpH family outer membrane protein n=1 Tax=unclassified Pseudoalteromonas TaxID=194690 RepID=UPI000CF6D20A|nr:MULTISPECIES: OmpH family outer membrane protein [unclassified Pseudoalteromonas]